ncbi:hypothetical protein B566_EDAN012552 [Ephemera danica]|nr:hypothetical protein B566_EDAN012552 [Ephemera danica]
MLWWRSPVLTTTTDPSTSGVHCGSTRISAEACSTSDSTMTLPFTNGVRCGLIQPPRHYNDFSTTTSAGQCRVWSRALSAQLPRKPCFVVPGFVTKVSVFLARHLMGWRNTSKTAEQEATNPTQRCTIFIHRGNNKCHSSISIRILLKTFVLSI